MIKNREYWRHRSQMLEEAKHEKNKRYIVNLYKIIERGKKKCIEIISNWYARIAKNNEVGISEAKKLLDRNELAEFKWDVNEYIKKAEENERNKKWVKQLENASAKRHISKYDELMLRIQAAEEEMFAEYAGKVTECLEDVYISSYTQGLYEYGVKTNSIGAFDSVYINKKKLDSVLRNPWASDEKIFSDRIWKKKEQLINDLQQEIGRNIILGKSPADSIDYIEKKHEVTKSQAENLVQTETAFIHESAQQDVYEDLESEQYEILAVLDFKTSKICQEMDGKIFDTKDFQVGTNAPPFHPRCRTTTVPYDELWDGDQDEPRAYRGKDGKTHWTKSHLTYKEWMEQYVDADPEFRKYYDFKRKSNQNKSSDKEQFERYKNVLGSKNMPKTLEKFKEMKYNEPKKWNTLKHNYRIVNSYEDNSGKMEVSKILELDQKAFDIKTKQFTGKAKRKGNIAVMELDGDFKIANSQVDSINEQLYKNFSGEKSQVVCLKSERKFTTIPVGKRKETEVDSEAKLFEYAADIVKDGKKHKINLLSEKSMCDSCLGVMKQFKGKYPNVEVNAVSNKRERNAKNHGKPWRYRTE